MSFSVRRSVRQRGDSQLILALVALYILLGPAVASYTPAVYAAESAASPVATLKPTDLATENITALVAHPPWHKLYVGVLSRDARRRGLLVFDLNDSGQVVGAPRKYSDHPDPLPPGHHSRVQCLRVDARNRLLFLGTHGSQPQHNRALVAYALDAQGEPTGAPQAFDTGNPHHVCEAMTWHPSQKLLYTVGWGGEGVYLLELDERGWPTGKPLFQKMGSYGGSAIALSADGRTLYRGTYPSVVEVAELDERGRLAGTWKSHPIPGGPQEYCRFIATAHSLFLRDAARRLTWFRLDAHGAISGDLHTADSGPMTLPVEFLAEGTTASRLFIARESLLTDALTGAKVREGVLLQEVAVRDDGSPGDVVREVAMHRRAAVAQLAGGPGAALALKSLGPGFLGNHVAGLKVRCTLESLQTDGPPLPAVQPLVLGEATGYQRFAVAPSWGRIYAIVNEHLVSTMLPTTSGGATTAAANATVERLPCPHATGPIAVDERRKQIWIARRDGAVMRWRLDEQGVPHATDDQQATGLASIGALVVAPDHDRVYALGVAAGGPLSRGTVMAIAAGDHIQDAVLDAQRRRLYAVAAYQDRANTFVWKLDESGAPLADSPQKLPDGLPEATANTRQLFHTVRLDASRRKLYAAATQEDATAQRGYVVVRDLDEQGNGTPTVRHYRSVNPRGSCWAIELSHDGQWLFEAGWGETYIARRPLDNQGEPQNTTTIWNVGSYGKRQITAVRYRGSDLLLAGTHPSTIEVLPFRSPGEPRPAAQTTLSLDAWQTSLGLLREGVPSAWIDLDAVLKNGVGRGVLRCNLSGVVIRSATVRWEVAQQLGEQLRPLRTVELPIEGTTAALVIPRFGDDEALELATSIRTSAEEFQRYLEMARRHAVPTGERPRDLLVANGLIGIDSSPAALEAGMETLAILGHNTVQAWNWPGMTPARLRAAADRHGLTQFREAVYQPPAYFHDQLEALGPTALTQWAAGFRSAAERMGVRPNELKLLHMADEPGWYYPAVTDELRKDGRRLALFRDYLRTKGLAPADVGAATWDNVFPGKLSAQGTLPERRLFYWTTRYHAESLSLAFAAATSALREQVQPNLLTTTNLNNWPGRFYIPSPGAKIANNVDSGPDAGMGMPDWFDLGRKRAVTCLWTEDWFADHDAQLWSLYGDLLRCAAREGGIEYGGYAVGHSSGALRHGGRQKIGALIGHGAKVLDPYVFGPNLAFSDGWSEKAAAYRNVADGLRFVGQAERLLAPGRPRDGSVAIVFPQSSQVWDSNALIACYQQELYGLHAALIHANYPVDVIDELGLTLESLNRRKYSVLYVTAPNLSRVAQTALRAWVEAGGTLVLSPGACAADEYNESTSELRSLAGASQPAVPRVAPPHYSQAVGIERTALRPAREAASEPPFAVVQRVPLELHGATAIVRFPDSSVAATERDVGRGRLIALGFWPGVSYWLSPDRSDHTQLPTDWSAALRELIVEPAQRAKAVRHVFTNQPGVEACLLESERGIAVVLLNWTGKPLASVRVTVPDAQTLRHITGVESGQRVAEVIAGALQCELPLDAAEILLLEP